MEYVIHALFFALLVPVAVIDARSLRIPNPLCAAIAALGGGLTVCAQFIVLPFFSDRAWYDGLTALVVPLFFFIVGFAVARLKRVDEALGFGDVKLLAAIALYLGLQLTLFAAFVAVVAGSIIQLALIAFGVRSREDLVPLGTYIAVGAALAALFGDTLIGWYFGLLVV